MASLDRKPANDRRGTVALDGPLTGRPKGDLGAIRQRRTSLQTTLSAPVTSLSSAGPPMPTVRTILRNASSVAMLSDAPSEGDVAHTLSKLVNNVRYLDPKEGFDPIFLNFNDRTRERRFREFGNEMSLRYKRASILIFLLMALTLSLRDVVARETSHTYAQLVTSIDVAFVILHVLFLAYSFVPSGRIKHAGRLVASSAVALFASEVIPLLAASLVSPDDLAKVMELHHPLRMAAVLLVIYLCCALSRVRFGLMLFVLVFCNAFNVFANLSYAFPPYERPINIGLTLLATIGMVIGSRMDDHDMRAVFVRVGAVVQETQQLTSDLRLMRKRATDTTLPAAPIQQVNELLLEVLMTENLPGSAIRHLQQVIRILATTPLLYRPDLETNISHGKLKLDRDTKEWLMSEVTPLANGRRPSITHSTTPPVDASTRGESASMLDLRLVRTLDQETLLKVIDEWNFDLFRFVEVSNHSPLLHLFISIMEAHDLADSMMLDMGLVRAYISEIESGYHSDIPYHTSAHAADVLHAVHQLVKTSPRLMGKLSPSEKFALFLAAAIHDYDHPGLSNSFLVTTRSPLALMYNDLSPLENHHVSKALSLLESPKFRLLAHLDRKEQEAIRRLIIDIVLATDIARHFSLVSQFTTRMLADNVDLDTASDITLILQLLIKCADVSNPSKRMPIYEKWVALIMEEFYRQGDREREAGLQVSPYMDRHFPKVAKCQVSFITFICMPTYKAIGGFLDRNDLADEAATNLAHWQRIEQASDVPDTPSSPKPQTPLSSSSTESTASVDDDASAHSTASAKKFV